METAMKGIDRSVRVPLFLVCFAGRGGIEDVVLEPLSIWPEFKSSLEQGCMWEFQLLSVILLAPTIPLF
jgi:hypothetical protein